MHTQVSLWTLGEYGGSGSEGNGVVRDAPRVFREPDERSPPLAPSINDRVGDFTLFHRDSSAAERATRAADEKVRRRTFGCK